jgi:hypothetical protein
MTKERRETFRFDLAKIEYHLQVDSFSLTKKNCIVSSNQSLLKERKSLYTNVRIFFIVGYITYIIDEDKWIVEMEK